jgi:hypothetical protein
MPGCYAETLGGCSGRIELEHWIPRAFQRMMGPVDLSGLAWQQGRSIRMQPGTYAASRIICSRHHDELDTLDGNALAYFRNLLLIASARHISGVAGRVEDITAVIDGRALERWFLKTICGAIAAGAIEGVTQIPERWLQGLFERSEWPDQWAMYAKMGTFSVEAGSAAHFGIQFQWSGDGGLNGISVQSFGSMTMFSIEPPDFVGPAWLRRPRLLGASVQRGNGGDVLVGLPPDGHIRFEITWPGRDRIQIVSSV